MSRLYAHCHAQSRCALPRAAARLPARCALRRRSICVALAGGAGMLRGAMAGDPLDGLDGEPGPLYWVCGKERFLVDRAVARLKERALEARTRDFNYDLLYAKEAGPQKILA